MNLFPVNQFNRILHSHVSNVVNTDSRMKKTLKKENIKSNYKQKMNNALNYYQINIMIMKNENEIVKIQHSYVWRNEAN